MKPFQTAIGASHPYYHGLAFLERLSHSAKLEFLRDDFRRPWGFGSVSRLAACCARARLIAGEQSGTQVSHTAREQIVLW